MTVTLTPDQEKYVESEVRSGRFTSAEQVVAEALSRLMFDAVDEEIDDDTYEALLRSEEQRVRGEGVPLERVREVLRARELGRRV
jgi:Arc/MetJ-type ribon-helix-helix transcriptional regulator